MGRIKQRIRRPSPGTVIGCIALTVAMGGTAQALNGVNTVEHDDLQNNIVTSREIAQNEVRSNDLHNGAVHDEHLARMVEEDGPNVVINDPANDGDWSTGTEGTSQSVAQCPDGTRIISGTMEWDTDGGVNGDLAIVKMFANLTTNSWTAVGSSDEGTSESFHAVAYCIR
jgi:hypothetical protein